jgi:hypothetical protein
MREHRFELGKAYRANIFLEVRKCRPIYDVVFGLDRRQRHVERRRGNRRVSVQRQIIRVYTKTSDRICLVRVRTTA